MTRHIFASSSRFQRGENMPASAFVGKLRLRQTRRFRQFLRIAAGCSARRTRLAPCRTRFGGFQSF
jgi:hypothetical protein